MDVGPAFGLREIVEAILGSSALGAVIAGVGTFRLNLMTARKTAAETAKTRLEIERIQGAEAAEIERVINERVTLVLSASDKHIDRLTREIERLTEKVNELGVALNAARGELSAARGEIAQLRGRVPAAIQARPGFDDNIDQGI